LDRSIHKAVTLYTGLALLIGLFSRFVSIDAQNPIIAVSEKNLEKFGPVSL